MSDARGGAGETLNATALVHEAYLRLIDETQVEWQGRAHFFAIAARSMRRIIIDHARERRALRRRLYGAAHPTLGMSLMSLGLLRQRQGRPSEARELFEQALVMETELFGAKYPLAREARGYLEALTIDTYRRPLR